MPKATPETVTVTLTLELPSDLVDWLEREGKQTYRSARLEASFRCASYLREQYKRAQKLTPSEAPRPSMEIREERA